MYAIQPPDNICTCRDPDCPGCPLPTTSFGGRRPTRSFAAPDYCVCGTELVDAAPQCDICRAADLAELARQQERAILALEAA